MRTNRIEALSDGIFAIVMTLLILEIKVPYTTPELLFPAILALWPKFLSYFISFIVLGNLWVGHHNQMPFIEKSDRTYLWVNILFFFFISLLPFSAALLGEYHNRVSIGIYGLNSILAGLALYIHWRYALYAKLATNVTPEMDRLVRKRILFGPFIYAVGILAAFISPQLGIFFFIIPLIYYILPGSVDRFWR